MIGRVLEERHRLERSARVALALLVIAALFVIAPPASAAAIIVVTPTTVSVTEGGPSSTYQVSLQDTPTTDVVITVAPDGQSEVDQTELSFTAATSYGPVTVTVTAFDDAVVEGSHSGTIAHTVKVGSAPEYLLAPQVDVIANITDDDTASVSVSPTTVAVSEAGATATYNVVLTSQPTAAVTVTVSDDSQVNVDKATLPFTTGNWNIAQTVAVSAQPDAVVEGSPHFGTIAHSVASTDGNYNGYVTPSVSVSITDDDSAGVSVVQAGGSTNVAEGGATDTYTVVLTSQPTAGVTVTVSGDPDVGVNKTTLPFTTGNWNAPQTVMVTAFNDAIVEGGHTGTVTHGIQGGEAVEYTGVSVASVTATITDNDFGIAFDLAGSSTTEGNAGSTPAIVNLKVDTNGLPATTGPAAPAGATVQVARTGGTAAATDFTFATTTVPIGGLADGATVAVTVTVIGDTLNESNETVILGLQNASVGGVISTPNAHTVTILDNDGPPGLSVVDAVPVTEGPGTVEIEFTIALLPMSGQPITVNYATQNGTAVAPGDYAPKPTTPLTFAPGETTQVVKVTVANDEIDEIDETVLLNISGSPIAPIVDAQGVGTIKDDDNKPPKIDKFLITDAAGNPRTTFAVGETTKVNVEFSDPGVRDSHEVRVSWEDATPDFYLPMPGNGTGTYAVAAAHAYQIAAQHTITVIITDEEGAEVRQDAIPIIVAGNSRLDSVGLVDPASGVWRLRNAIGTVTTFYYGNPGDYPFVGDWDCDGVETPGLYRQSDGYVYLRNSNTQGIADIRFFFGNPGDIPLAGDFNGDGCDTVSIYRPSEGRVFVINKLGANDGGLGAAEVDYYFGNPGDKPFVGDFNGNGIETVGLHRETTGLVYFRNSHTQGNADNQFYFGDPGDRLVAGDWIRSGIDTPALFRPSNTTMYFRHSNTQGNADDQFVWGQPSWLPVAGYFGS